MRPKRHIVLVDDNEQTLSLRTFMFETRGYRITAFWNAAEALDFLAHAKPHTVDLLLSDLIMPDIDGNELVRRAKQLHPTLPTMIVSGQVSGYDRAQAADAFLPKGVNSPVEVLERARILCSRKRGPRAVVQA